MYGKTLMRDREKVNAGTGLGVRFWTWFV